MELPKIIQGGMGAGVSNWVLANAVSRIGQLGVVSGTALDVIVSRLRRKLAVHGLAESIETVRGHGFRWRRPACAAATPGNSDRRRDRPAAPPC